MAKITVEIEYQEELIGIEDIPKFIWWALTIRSGWGGIEVKEVRPPNIVDVAGGSKKVIEGAGE